MRLIPKPIRQYIDDLAIKKRGISLSNNRNSVPSSSSSFVPPVGHLDRYFDANLEGRGIWKWQHYFEIYERHLSKFRDRPVRIVEIGVFSGGSLRMWKDYFGPQAHIIGVDIEEACKKYAEPGIDIIIGDQSDRSFWRKFRDQVGPVDVVIDDGGHTYDQQMTSLEELLPYMSLGGVYLCEDIMGTDHDFTKLVFGLADTLNDFRGIEHSFDNPERRLVLKAHQAQTWIKGVSLYPMVAVVELSENPVDELVSPKRGTLWEPFLG